MTHPNIIKPHLISIWFAFFLLAPTGVLYVMVCYCIWSHQLFNFNSAFWCIWCLNNHSKSLMTQMTLMTLRTGMTLMKQWHWWPWWQIVFEKFLNMSSISNSSFLEVPATTPPPSHQASHSGQHRDIIWTLCFYLVCKKKPFRPRPEDPKSSLIHFQHGGSGNWMPLFKRFKLFLKVFSLGLVECLYIFSSKLQTLERKKDSCTSAKLTRCIGTGFGWYWIW